jgi:CheY-like chemotaxis protein
VTEGTAFRVYRARALDVMDTTAWLAPLAGQTILVVEDEALISLDIEATLLEAGAEVLTAGDQPSGLAAASDTRLTASVLDVRLGKDSIDPICDALDRRWVPFLFLTGDSGSAVEKWSPAPVLPKPFASRALIDGVLSILVTGRDAIDLGDRARIDLIIFRAQIRLARQELCAGELARRGQDSQSANSLLRMMRESVDLLLTHRLTLTDGDEIRH